MLRRHELSPALRHISEGDQTRGGRKGGLPDCECTAPVTSNGTVLAEIGGSTSSEKKGPVKLQHLSAQAAMDVQSSIVWSHGLSWSGQQSRIGSETDISLDFVFKVTPPATGSIATETATVTANMVRPMPMDQLCVSEYPVRLSGGQVMTSRASRLASPESLWCPALKVSSGSS
jgi:hypothetical protein